MVRISVVLPAEQAALIDAAVEAAARAISPTDQGETGEPPVDGQPHRLPPKDRVQALVDLAATYLETLPGEPADDHTLVVVHVNARGIGRSLGNARRLGHLLRRGPRPDRACDRRTVAVYARVQGVLVGRGGKVLSLGRTKRLATRAQRRALKVRDRGVCQFPGCHATSHLDAHHVVHWSHGGTTDLDKLASFQYALCDDSHMTERGAIEKPISIRSLCAAWKEAAIRDGGIAIGGESEQYRLHANGVRFHDLSYQELREAAVGLCDILLLPGLNTIIDRDHELLWSWCGEVLLGRDAPLASTADSEIRELATTTLRASLANVRPPAREAYERARTASDLMEHNAREFLMRAHVVLAYLAFPLLEATARRACSDFVDLRGKVLASFPRASGQQYKVGTTCSSVADLLRLLASTASPSLQKDLADICIHIAELDLNTSPVPTASDGYDIVYRWRNSSLHGEMSLTTIGGTVLTLALLVALDAVRDDYEIHRQAALSRAQRELSAGQTIGRWRPSPYSFYPPFP